MILTLNTMLRRKPRHRTLRTLALVAMLAVVGLALGGPGGGGVEIPVSSLVAGGGSHSVVLPNGDPLDVDFSIGSAMGGEGTGVGDYSLSSGFQVQREAIEQGSGPIGAPFRRGDTNADGLIDLADAIATLNFLFIDGPMNCADAGDNNDDGLLDLADAIFLMNYLFISGATQPAPGPDNCGPDPTDDTLGCDSYNSC